jgi:hypothetical protein
MLAIHILGAVEQTQPITETFEILGGAARSDLAVLAD